VSKRGVARSKRSEWLAFARFASDHPSEEAKYGVPRHDLKDAAGAARLQNTAPGDAKGSWLIAKGKVAPWQIKSRRALRSTLSAFLRQARSTCTWLAFGHAQKTYPGLNNREKKT
jgi:hypothetical protein